METMVSWWQLVMLTGVLAACGFALAAFAANQQGRNVARVACYVALANDVTPLVARDMPDTVAASRECARWGLRR